MATYTSAVGRLTVLTAWLCKNMKRGQILLRLREGVSLSLVVNCVYEEHPVAAAVNLDFDIAS